METATRATRIEYRDFKPMYDIAKLLHDRWIAADSAGDARSKALLGHASQAVSLALDACRLAEADGNDR